MKVLKKDVSVDMYHRIYRMAVKKIPSDRIAVSLDLPINTVRIIVSQFFPQVVESKNKKEDTAPLSHEIDKQPYLDIYILQRLRFSILDLNGMLTDNSLSPLEQEFDKILRSKIKMIAIRLTNVKSINKSGLSVIQTFYEKYVKKGRHAALLDPSQKVETFLSKNKVEVIIPIFGTEKAFEENIQKIKKQKLSP